jgi:hypothetical protein
MEVLQWAVGLLVMINLGATSWIATQLWAHVIKCGHVSSDMGSMKADLERMKQDIGTHDSGLRGNVHATANLCTQHEMRLSLLEHK